MATDHAASLTKKALDVINVLASTDPAEWQSKDQIKPVLVEARDDLREALRLLGGTSEPISEGDVAPELERSARAACEASGWKPVRETWRQFLDVAEGVRASIRPGDRLSKDVVAVRGDTQVRHVKRGSTYTVLGLAAVQVSKPTHGVMTANAHRRIHDDNLMVVYIDHAGRLWARFPDEMYDGRFEEVGA